MIPYQPIKYLGSIGSFQIPVWGFCVSFGAILFLLFSYQEAKRLGLDEDRWRTFFLITAIAGLIGTRLYYFIVIKGCSNFSKFFGFTAGQASYGFVLGLFFGYIYLKKKNLSLGRYLDSIAIPLTGLVCFGRIGCFLVGDHLGTVSNVPWAIFYGGALRHPIALYYIVTAAILFIILTLFKKTRIFNGFLFLLFAVLYSLMRFVLGFLRVEPIVIFNLSEHQIAYLISFVVFLVILLWNLRKPKLYGASDILR